jgi:hypothetical protein
VTTYTVTFRDGATETVRSDSLPLAYGVARVLETRHGLVVSVRVAR